MRSPKPSNLARASDRARHRSRSRSVPRVASRPRPLNRQPDDCAADQGCHSTGSTCEAGAPAKPDTCEAGSKSFAGSGTCAESRNCGAGSTGEPGIKTGSRTQDVGGTTLRAHHRNDAAALSHATTCDIELRGLRGTASGAGLTIEFVPTQGRIDDRDVRRTYEADWQEGHTYPERRANEPGPEAQAHMSLTEPTP